MSNKYQRGFSAIELILIIVVLLIVGVFVYFASQSKKTVVDMGPQSQTSTTSTSRDQSPVQSPKVVSNQVVSANPAPVGLDKDSVIGYVRQLSVEAEARYSGSYKKTFTSNNIIKDNGAGILLTPGSLGAKLADEVKSKGGQIFVITNEAVTKFAIYGLLSGPTKTYYCLASDGSNKTDTKVVTDTVGLTKKPICK